MIMINSAVIATRLANKVAADPKSLTFLTLTLYSKLTMSERCSKDVLTISKPITIDVNKKIINHSIVEMFNKIPKTIILFFNKLISIKARRVLSLKRNLLVQRDHF